VKAEVLMAVVGPMTGQYAIIGAQMAKGATMAVQNLNAAGGIKGEKVRLEVLDDACDPKQATVVANKLAGQGAALVVGHFCSSASIAASDIYSDAGVVMITPASTNPQLTERKLPFIFRLCGRDDQQGLVAAEYMAKNYPKASIAILNDRSAYGRGLADEVKMQLNKRGVREKLFEAVVAGERDFSALLARLRQQKIDFVYLGGYHTEAGLMKRQAAQQGYPLTLMAGDALVTKEYWTITGAAGENTLMTFSPDPRLNPQAQPVVAAFKKTNYDPEGYTLYTYAAVQTFAEAAKRAGSAKAEAVRKALHIPAPLPTILGPVRFDAKGDNLAPGYRVYRWKAGQYAYADAAPVAVKPVAPVAHPLAPKAPVVAPVAAPVKKAVQ
jgi:branched-chain amino acid transport system substrate-binding protein